MNFELDHQAKKLVLENYSSLLSNKITDKKLAFLPCCNKLKESIQRNIQSQDEGML